MYKLFTWLDEKKKNKKKKTLMIILEVVYKFGISDWTNETVVAILGIFIPILIEKSYIKSSIFLIVLLLFDIVLSSICSKYQKRKFRIRRIASTVLNDQSCLLNSLVIEMTNNTQWRTSLFRTASELVCERIKALFKNTLKCDTRVSVEYVFEKEHEDKARKKTTTETYIKMAGRRSAARSTCKQAEKMEKRSKYFSYKIFTSSNENEIHILPKEKIDDSAVWFKKPNCQIDIKKYIGIAISTTDTEKVDYILQIDCLDNVKFGDNNTDQEIETFINKYLKPYINIVSLSYILTLNKKKIIPEG